MRNVLSLSVLLIAVGASPAAAQRLTPSRHDFHSLTPLQSSIGAVGGGLGYVLGRLTPKYH